MANWVRFKASLNPGEIKDMTYTVMEAAGRMLEEVITRIYPGSGTLLDVDMYIIRAGTLIREGIFLNADGSEEIVDGENDTFEEDRLGIRLLMGDILHVKASNSDPAAILPIYVRMRLDVPGRPGPEVVSNA